MVGYNGAVPGPLALSWYEQLDRSVFHWINCDLHAPWLQDVLFFIQSKSVGVPLVLALIGGIVFLRGWRIALRTLVTCALGFLVSWMLASSLWSTLQRPRPPRVLAPVLRTPAEHATCATQPDAVAVRKYVSQKPGFPSQHAQHSALFAAALFLAVRWLGVAAGVYAVLVALARVLMGAHWPSDVVAGLLIGPFVAWGVWWCVPRLFGLVGRRAWVETQTREAHSEGTAEAASDRG
jgi:undecaprenyl-diphosphatase